MSDIIVIAIVVVVLGLAIGYIVRQKRSGAKCIGCAHSKTCSSGSCSCGCGEQK